ncbi:PB1-F2 protein [Influenza A virus]
MEQGLGTLWTQSTEHTNTQREGSGRQIQKLGLPSSTRPFLKNPTQVSLKTPALKQWKPFNRQG